MLVRVALGCQSQPDLYVGVLVRGVVVHHQMQVDGVPRRPASGRRGRSARSASGRPGTPGAGAAASVLRSPVRSHGDRAPEACPSEEHPPGPPVPWTGSDPATTGPWSLSSRPTLRSGCSPPRRLPAARSERAWLPRPAPSRHASIAQVPHDHQHEEPTQGQDDSPCLMISDLNHPEIYDTQR
jgi:hypothetical protein